MRITTASFTLQYPQPATRRKSSRIGFKVGRSSPPEQIKTVRPWANGYANFNPSAWRKLLKDLIGYFREIQASYETKSKAFMKISNVINNTSTPTIFLSEGGLDDATSILRGYHKHAQSEAQKARDIENEVIAQLSGLRADLQQKIKEINKLSGDFKNSADKEKEGTRRMVNALQDALVSAETQSMTGGAKSDPFILRLNVDRQVERQLEEENYLHRVCIDFSAARRD